MGAPAFELFGKVSLDTNDVDKKLKSIGPTLKKGLATAAKAGAVAIGAASVALVKLTKDATKAYANFEQLEGGVKKLFGKKSMQIVMDNAEKAFETAGMSANEYMETVTSFSSALIQSLGGDTKKAAKLADVAIQDMSDNANTFGTDISSIQAAYQGFAKQNYTMLDNLKLGYGGTKSEMERLIKDANKIRKSQGKSAKLSIKSYADIVKAINTVQKEMGIYGTTAAEASKTVEGSIKMTKAAWGNFLIALGKGKGVKKAMKNLTSSAKTALTNIMPVVKNVLKGVATAIGELAPVVIEELPKLIKSVAPELLNAAIKIVAALVKALPGILKAVTSSVLKVARDLYSQLHAYLEEKFPKLAEVFDKVVDGIKDAFKKAKELVENVFDKIKETAENVADAIKTAFRENQVLDAFKSAIDRIKDALKRIKKALSPAIEKIESFFGKTSEAEEGTNSWATAADALAQVLTKVADGAAKIVEGVASFVEWLDSGSTSANLFKAAVSGIVVAFVAYNATMAVFKTVTAGAEIVMGLLNATMSLNPAVAIAAGILGLVVAIRYLWKKSEGFRDFWSGAWEGIKEAVSTAKTDLEGDWETIKEGWDNLKEDAEELRKTVVLKWNLLKLSVKNAANDLKEKASQSWSDLKTNVSKSAESIRSTASTKWTSLKTAVSNTAETIKSTASSKWEEIKKTVSEKAQGMYTTSNAWITTIKGSASSAWDSIKSTASSKWEEIKSTISTKWQEVKDFFKETLKFKVELPNIRIVGTKSLFGGRVTIPDIEINRKAYEEPYMFKKKTVVGNYQFGDYGIGGEMVYGHDNLMNDIRKAVAEAVGGSGFTQNLYISSPTATQPSEIARQSKIATRQMILALKGV